MRTKRSISTRPTGLLAPLAALTTGVLLTGGLSGCVGYVTYPSASWQMASDNMNAPPADEIMIESVRWAVTQYETGSDGHVAINLPEPVRDRTYAIISERAGERVVHMERGLEDLPTYHLTRLWVRGDKAEVDLLRPVTELGESPTGRPIVQAVTIYLRGGLRSWTVDRARHWKIGTDEVPALHYFGEEPPAEIEADETSPAEPDPVEPGGDAAESAVTESGPVAEHSDAGDAET